MSVDFSAENPNHPDKEETAMGNRPSGLRITGPIPGEIA